MTTEPTANADPVDKAEPVKNTESTKKADPVADVAAARAQLASTLDALQDKLNVPKRIRTAARENPIGLATVGAGVAAAIAGAVWLAVRVIRSR